MIVQAEPVTIRLPHNTQLRSKGIHQSRLVKLMAIDGEGLKPDLVEDMSLIEPGDLSFIEEPEALLRISLGLAWEEWYIRTQLGHYVMDHPGEYVLDGIYMSPDGEEMSAVLRPSKLGSCTVINHIIHEVKATYKSVKTVGMLQTQEELKRNWMWLAQLKNYCKAAGTNKACLHVLFLAGNYKPAFKPQLRKFKITFTQEELDTHWALTLDYLNYKLQEEK